VQLPSAFQIPPTVIPPHSSVKNEGATRIFGYTVEEVIGKPVTILMPPDRVNEETNVLNRVRKGERIDHYETVRMRKDGSLVDISLSVSPVSNERGEIVGASKIARSLLINCACLSLMIPKTRLKC